MFDLRSTVHIQDFIPNLACDGSVYFTYENAWIAAAHILTK